MTNVTPEYVIKFLKDHKAEFHEKFGVSKIGLFGSTARGNRSIASDIDIAIEMDQEKKSLKNFLSFKRYLEEQFGTTVDLGIESSLKETIKEKILSEMIYV